MRTGLLASLLLALTALLPACGNGGDALVSLAEDYADKVCAAQGADARAALMREYGAEGATMAKHLGRLDAEQTAVLVTATDRMRACVKGGS